MSIKNDFDPEAFRPITLEDKEELFPILAESSCKSCEFAFGNLFSWKTHTGLLWQKAFGRLYFYYRDVDKLAFTLNGETDCPSPGELACVSRAMKKISASGDYFVVPPSVTEKYSCEEWEKYFILSPAPEEELEYIYRISDLHTLPGKLLAKKRNLISQFRKNFPSATTEEISGENLFLVREIAAEWAKEHLRHDLKAREDVYMEEKAVELTLGAFDSLGAKGILLRDGKKGIAFAVGFPITKEIWAEPFEKALPDHKGASQSVLQELAALLEKEGVLFLNREQDMGLEGLRQAKRSYQPRELLASLRLQYKGDHSS